MESALLFNMQFPHWVYSSYWKALKDTRFLKKKHEIYIYYFTFNIDE